MERLTERYTPELVYLIGNGQTYNTRSRSKMAKALDRLASYEDTGLTPEEAKYFGRLVRGERMVTEEDLVESGVSQEEIQRLKDVITAEAEGRLLVLPCKIGDTVYQTDGVNVYKSKVTRLIFDTENYFAFDERAIGKIVFLTREEAEAALNHEGTTRNGAENKMTYELYQLPSLEEVRRLMFLSWDQMKQNGYTIDPRKYECVYMGKLEGTNLKAELEALYRKFNGDFDREAMGYTGRSMSVSDVIVIRGQGKPRAFYCDSIGFKEIEWEMM